ncbi:uncharacterized protein LOC132740171 isoform X2 [Ruditapes philippinarum]|uniref:uncharacterized protein LOC132740171 isoform X2 n=1 Tax=Ruditapes philippinarum TaxID=129788 RepID=UPI00295B2CD5|nr:uncharacterized protein LOC132740171 isoform X2 [Ruditapes philippinarum]
MFELQDSNSKINLLFTTDENTLQVVPTYQSGTITIDSNGYIYGIPTCVTSCDTVDDTEISNAYNSGATNFLSADAMDMTGYEQVPNVADSSSIMEMYNIKDKDLADAAAKAMVDGNMTPLIKEELKCSIQSKRLKAGKPELKVEFTDPEPCQLTETEQMKVEKRKIQNRLAAQRFRNKQKTRGDQLHKECLKLQSVQTQLRFELSQVKKERDELKQKLQDHYAICPLRYTTQYYSQQNSTG